MPRPLSCLACLLFILLPVSSAEALVLVVHPDGSGDCPTIQAAIDSVNFSGDIIELTDGVFTGFGNRDLFTSGKSLLIRSQSGDPTSCIIDVQGRADEWHFGILFVEDG